MTRWTRFPTLFLLFAGLPQPAQQPPTAPLHSGISYDLDVAFQPSRESLEGRARIRFRQPERLPDPLVFYLHGELRTLNVEVGGEPAAFKQAPVLYEFNASLVANRVEVRRPLQGFGRGLEVTYAGPIHASNVRTRSDYMRIDAEGVLLRGYGYSLWFPMFLEAKSAQPARVDFDKVVLRTPEAFLPVFVGQRLDETVEGGVRSSTWTSPDTDPFQVQCTARRFKRLAFGHAEMFHLDEPSSAAAAKGLADLAGKLEERYRRWYRAGVPAQRIHLLEMPEFGDISSGNVIGLAGRRWKEGAADPAAKDTLAHELVHAFVETATPRGDRLYCLAQEGFPSYFHLPALADLEGEAGYLATLRKAEHSYLKARSSGKTPRGEALPAEPPLLALTAEDLPTYKDGYVLRDRARLFLHWLRSRIGPQRFPAFTRSLFAAPGLTEAGFRRIVGEFLPGAAEDLRVWLETTDYPDAFRIEPAAASARS